MIPIELQISVEPMSVELHMDISAEYHTYPEYNGPFMVIPDKGYHILRTAGTVVPSDIVIYPIPE